MRWDPGHQSDDVIDRRGDPPDRGGGGLGLLGLAGLLFRIPYGWVILLVIVALSIAGGVWRGLIGGGAGTASRAHAPAGAPHAAGRDRDAEFVSFVLDDAQATWQRELGARGITYRRAKLVLFTEATRTSCGRGEAAVGPFYCPADERVYLDLTFFRELERRHGAPGDFAQAYVVAHEIGHHVQRLLGTSDAVHRAPRAEQRGPEGQSVRLELQADCYAGIWAHSTQRRHLLEQGDVEEGLRAAAAVGDDRLQRLARGTVQPESWTHGSSAMRSRWFKRGLTTGSLEACDTFRASTL